MMMKLVHIKFSDFDKFVNWCNQLTIHFARLVRTNFSKQSFFNSEGLTTEGLLYKLAVI